MAEQEKETIVETRSGAGGTAAVVIAIIIVLLVALYLMFGRGLLVGGSTKAIKADVNVNVHAPSGG